jgi:divinyl protochlorophyllide a 8-vinyl-reductase
MNDGVTPMLSGAGRQAGVREALVCEGQGGSNGASTGHRVGPNAIIQTRAALIDAFDAGRARRVFADAGIADWFDALPGEMVPAEAVHRLNMALLASLDGEAFEALMADAGARTGRYILQNRIPGAARAVLKLMPAALASRALLKAIRANAWTFAGNAEVSVTPGHPAMIEIAGNPLPMPGCPWHRAVFETLFATLLGKPVRVDHQLGLRGGRLDRFTLRWRG